MRTYELTAILRPEKVDEGKQIFADILTKNSVQIKSDEDWGHRRLAYAIDECSEGFYLFKIVEAAPESIDNVLREFKLNTVFLRSMFVLKSA